jgi:pyruvate dehydrogenase (quinone)/pyruvate oxidase
MPATADTEDRRHTAADVLVGTLIEWGVDVVFGLPGDGVNGIIEAFRKREADISFVQVRHEGVAAFAACGYAKVTGKLGVCVSTSGPGALHMANGLYDAKLDGAAVLAITGLQFHDLLSTRTQQDVETDRVFADVALYNARCMGPAHMRNVASMACRQALSHRQVAHIATPVDVQSMPVKQDTRSKRNVAGHTAQLLSRSARLPTEADLQAAAELINDAERPVILAGRGALGQSDRLEALAKRVGAPICKALLGKAAVTDDSPFTTGPVGLLGSEPSQDALDESDCLIIVGSSWPYIEFYPDTDQARCVQIDLDPTAIGLRYPTDVGLIGDAGAVLDALLPLLNERKETPFLRKAQEGATKWWALMEERGTRQDTPMKPQVVAWELGRRLQDDAIVPCDSGTVTTWWARQIPARTERIFPVSGNLASMGCALPYAIAAQVAYPVRQVVAFAGDGGFSMHMADFVTAVKYRLPIKVVVMNNESLGMIKWEQMAFLGNPEFVCDNARIDFHPIADAMGGKGFFCDDPARIGEVLDAFLAHEGPALLHCDVDPHEPPLPPHVSLEQAKQMAKALIRGTPEGGKIARTVSGTLVRELI